MAECRDAIRVSREVVLGSLCRWYYGLMADAIRVSRDTVLGSPRRRY